MIINRLWIDPSCLWATTLGRPKKRPLDREVRIIPPDATLVGGRIKRRGFIGHIGELAEHEKAMGGAGRDPDHGVVFGAQFESEIFSERGRITPQIDRHIVDGSGQHAKRACPARRARPDSATRAELHARNATGCPARRSLASRPLRRTLFGSTFEKKSPVVTKDARGDEHHPGQFGCFDLHARTFLAIKPRRRNWKKFRQRCISQGAAWRRKPFAHGFPPDLPTCIARRVEPSSSAGRGKYRSAICKSNR